jgi:hypothetical protein
LTQSVQANGSVRLSWVAVPGATGYTVVVDGGVQTFSVQGNLTSYTVQAAALTAGTHTFTVTAQTLTGTTAATPTAAFNGVAFPPVVPSAVADATPGMVTLGWANDPRNVNNVTGLHLTWSFAGSAVDRVFAPTTTGTTVTGLTKGVTYNFKLVAESRNGNSTQVSLPAVVAP